MSLVSTPFSEETVYDLTIRLYGNINGFTCVVPSLDTINDDVTEAIIFEPIEFVDFVEPEQPDVSKPDLVYKIGESQSIYDLAIQLTGKLQGIESIISNYAGLDDDFKGVTITLPRKNDILVDIFLENEFIFATKEGLQGLGNWILATTDWRDVGLWIDTEFWQD